MFEKNKDGQGRGGRGRGAVYVVGIGPGDLAHLTVKAKSVIENAECVVGYTRYVSLVESLLAGKEVYATGMTHEVERCKKAIELAASGKRVAVVSSGDAGIYGMAGLVLELLRSAPARADIDVEVVAGVPAFVSAASMLGAPLMHDFASISLSDLLTPWAVIEKRVEAAASADFVIILYNPKSSGRTEGLGRALDAVGRHRSATTPAGIVKNATRVGEKVVVTTLAGLTEVYGEVDMLSIIIIGNSSTFVDNGVMITPRGYGV